MKGSVKSPRKLFLAAIMKAAEGGKATILEQLIQKQVDLAMGIVVEREVNLPRAQGKMMVYMQPPDQKAGQFLIEQGIGKAMQAIEVRDPGENFDASEFVTE